MITLAYDSTTLQLSDRLVWSDEFSWSPVVQATETSTTGALLVDVGLLVAGREITLQGAETATWLTRATCVTLRAWAALPTATFTLVLRGVARQVIFNRERGGFDATPVWHLADGQEDDSDLLVPTLRFLEL